MKCKILKDNLEAEQERNITLLTMMEYVEEEISVIAAGRETLLKL